MQSDSARDRSVWTAGLRPDPADGHGWHSRRYLPHFDRPGSVQMLTFRLADALPVAALREIERVEANKADRSGRVETLLDAGHGSCVLCDPPIAELVRNALLHFDGERYHLLAWVIMPNHVHVLIETLPGHPLSSVLQSWKSFTAKEANKLLGQSGTFWQSDYFDRMIRDERHFVSAVEYIHGNPVKAGLVTKEEELAL